MQCPACDVTLSISSREGIEIDFCPQCRGVWLDRGELDKVIERTMATSAVAAPAPSAAAPERRYDEHDRPRDDRGYDERYAKKKKRRSFLEDLFEFD